MTPIDPELDEPREINPTLTLPGAATVDGNQDAGNQDADGAGYTFFLRDGITPYRCRKHSYDVFGRVDDGWMGQQMIDPDHLWESSPNEIAGIIGGAERLDEPRVGWVPYRPIVESEALVWALVEAADRTPTGAMVALYPQPEVAKALALKGGDPQDQLHCTLAFLGDAHDIADPEGLVSTVEDWAARTPPLDGEISGYGLFTAGREPVTYVSPELPGLLAAREDVVSSLQSGGHHVATLHGFAPHMTLGYMSPPDDMPDHGGRKLHFSHASLVVAGDRQDFIARRQAAGGRQLGGLPRADE
jgi:2'-5' RNA ligase